MFPELFFTILILVAVPYLLASFLPFNGITIGTRWVLGLIIIGYSLAIFHATEISKQITYGIFYALILILVLVKIYWFVKKPPDNLFKINKLNAVDIIFFFGLSVFTIHSFLLVLSDPISAWDAVAIWYQKTLAYHYWVPLQQIPTINYPNLLPIFWSFILNFCPSLEACGRLVFPFVYHLFFLDVYLQFKTNQKKDLYICALLLYCASIFRNDLTYNGYQDAAILSVAGIAIANCIKIYTTKYSLVPNKENLRTHFYIVIILLGSVGFIKNEGIIFSLILLPLPLITYLRFKMLKKSDLLILPAVYFGILFFWQIILYLYDVDLRNIQGDAFRLDSAGLLLTQLYRLDVIMKYFHNFFMQYSLVISGALILSALTMLSDFSKALLISTLWLSIILHAAFITLIFMLTKQDLGWHLDSAFSRLMYQSCFFYVLLYLVTTLSTDLKLTASNRT